MGRGSEEVKSIDVIRSDVEFPFRRVSPDVVVGGGGIGRRGKKEESSRNDCE